MKINKQQIANYGSRQFQQRNANCCVTPAMNRWTYGDGSEGECNCDFDPNWGGPYSYSFFNRSFTTPDYCLTLPFGCEYTLKVTAGPVIGGIGDFNLIKNNVDITPLPAGISVFITLVTGDCFALQWDNVDPILDDNYVNFDLVLSLGTDCEVFNLNNAVFIDYTEETYHILAETGDILNAENNDKLRTE